IDPQHWDDEPFEAIVSNPPYSIRWDGDANPLLINDPRFAPAGVLAPKSRADLAFTMHMLSWLAVNGTAAIVQFPGVLYRGDAEHFVKLVPNADLAANAYNLSVTSYVEEVDTSETVDIKSLNAEIADIVARQQELRTQIDVIVADLESDA